MLKDENISLHLLHVNTLPPDLSNLSPLFTSCKWYLNLHTSDLRLYRNGSVACGPLIYVGNVY